MSRQLHCALPVPLWTTTSLQLAHKDTAVKHSVMALGVLGRGLQTRTSVVSLVDDDEDENRCVAYSYYGRALMQLRQNLSPENQTPILEKTLCCLFLAIFEFLCGNDTNLMTHLKAALAMALTLKIPASNDNSDSPEYQLFHCVWICMMAIADWMDSPTSISKDVPVDFTRLYTGPDVPTFYGVCDDLDRQLMNVRNIMLNLQWTQHWQPETPSLPESVRALRAEVEDILDNMDRSVNNEMSTLGMIRYKVVRIHALVIRPVLAQMEDPLEDLEQDYSETLDIAEYLLKKRTQLLDRVIFEQTRNHYKVYVEGLAPLFNFATVLIQPLYHIATHSYNSIRREKALALLDFREWREGAWDSTVMARLARQRFQHQHSTDIP